MLSPSRLPQTCRTLMPSKTTIGLLLGCLAWYLTSALSSTTSKAILSAPRRKRFPAESTPAIPQVAPFPLPVTLTWIQFLFVHGFCLLACCKSLWGRHVVSTVAPARWSRIVEVGQLSVFTVVGHALSSLAISRVPVATVQTIKALAPLFTVLAYAGLFGTHYHPRTWLSLVPLTIGVMMACTGRAMQTQAGTKGGLVAALASTVIFVAQNIYSKKLLNGNGHGPAPAPELPVTGSEKGTVSGLSSLPKNAGKLDKINILLYSSGCASVLMVPMVIYYDGRKLLAGHRADGQSLYSLHVASLIWCNGVVQFAQNLFAFTVLSLVSPVTYSVASLIKRVFVICVAIVWFHQAVTPVQLLGIILTFGGLYLYNNAKTLKSIPAADARTASTTAWGAQPTWFKDKSPSMRPREEDEGGATVVPMPVQTARGSSPDTTAGPRPASSSTATRGRWLAGPAWMPSVRTHSHSPSPQHPQHPQHPQYPQDHHQQPGEPDMLRLLRPSVPGWARPGGWSYAAGYAHGHATAYRPGEYAYRGGGRDSAAPLGL